MSRPRSLKPHSLKVQVLSRRDALRLGSATLVLGAASPGCDSLTLPAGALDAEIPPVSSNADFYVQSCCGTAEVDGSSWRLSIQQDGVELAGLDLAFLEGLPARDKEHTLQCIGGGPGYQAIDNAIWSGLPLLEILEALGVTVPETAIQIRFLSADDYSTSIPISDLDLPIWLVWRMNGESLPPDHGFPARFLVPGRYGTKNPKWPIELDFIQTPYTGYWESRGWSDDASYLANTFVASPEDGGSVEDGRIVLLGTAFAGDDPIVVVELSADGGQTWTPAEITYAGSADVWSLWRFVFEPEGPGEYRLQVRCTTASGDGSAPDSVDPDPLDGYEGSMAISIQVI